MPIFNKDKLHRLEPSAAPRPRVMLVDDEQGNRQVMAAILAPHFEVVEAANGRDALAMVQDFSATDAPACIVSDYRMPHLSGVEFFERTLPVLPGASRIIVTGFIDVNAIVDAINKAEIYRFIVKPFDSHDFLLTVQRGVEVAALQARVRAHQAELEGKVRERTAELQRERDFSRALVDAIPELFLLVAPEHRVAMANPQAPQMLGRPLEALLQQPVRSLVGESDREVVQSLLARAFAGEETSGEVEFETADGGRVPHYLVCRRVQVDAGVHVIVVGVDITTRRQAEAQMRLLALHDGLTGLPNRLMLDDRLAQALALAQRRRDGVAVLFIDLDGFKAINDGAGHEAGDAVLREVAARLRQAMRASDTVARYGGDEFVIVLPEVQGLDGAGAAATKLIEAVQQPVLHAGQAHRVGASVGIALYPDHARDAGALMELADAAMYRAKREGKGRWVLADA